MCICTIIGNALVIATFIKFPSIRNKISNLYILNLAVSDFVIGCVAIPLSILYRQHGIWLYGEVVCKFWLVVDWWACFVTVWAIVLISYDRYVLVTKGLEYDKYQTRKKFYILSGLSWIGCFVRYAGGFLFYDIWNDNNVDYAVHCSSPTLFLYPLIVFDLIATICVPVALICCFNIVIYANIHKRSRGLPRVSNGLTGARVQPSHISNADGGLEVPQVNLDHNSHVTSDGTSSAGTGNPVKREGTNDIRKLRRSALTLGLIVSVSAICWTPYYAYVLATIYKVEVHIKVILTTYYIWWGNSAANPLLFVATNP